jgi:hypothetical protein
MPSNALVSLSNALIVDKGDKLTRVNAANTRIEKLTGVYTLRSPVGGRISVRGSDSAEDTQKRQQNMVGPSVALDSNVKVLRDPEVNTSNAPVYKPETTDFAVSPEDLDVMESEIGSYFQSTPEVLQTQSDLTKNQVEEASQQRATLNVAIKQIEETINLINQILQERSKGTAKEPKLNFQAIAGSNDPRVEAAAEANVKFLENQIIAPFNENKKIVDALRAQFSGSGSDVPMFDLEFGPPVSTYNQYVLSEDGLYYDSRDGTVPRITPQPTSSTMWDLEFAPNKGGKGVQVSREDVLDVNGTIFSFDYTKGDGHPQVALFYKYDDLLKQFQEDKEAHLYQASSHIKELQSAGFGTTDAIMQSYVSQLGSISNIYDLKIKKRRKQLSLAALFGASKFSVTSETHPLGPGVFLEFSPPQGKAFEYKLDFEDTPPHLLNVQFITTQSGDSVMYDTSTNTIVDDAKVTNVLARIGSWSQIPRIPVNDFSYLKGSTVDIEFQKNITLFSEDLEDIILPFRPRYVVGINKPVTTSQGLNVDPPAVADWVHPPSGTSVSASPPLMKSLTDNIVTNDLVLCYNFLDPGSITAPSSSTYALNNAAEGSPRMDGKFVSFDKSFSFPSGVGIAYLGGVLYDTQEKHNALFPSTKGSFVRLPTSTKDIDEKKFPTSGVKSLENLFYTQNGATVEFWCHVPSSFEGLTDSHRYRIVLGGENSSPQSGFVAAGMNQAQAGTLANKTTGLIIGFRDKGSPNSIANWTKDYNPTYADKSTSGFEFVVLPTVGQNTTQEGVSKNWGHSICIAETFDPSTFSPSASQVTELGFMVPSGLQTPKGDTIMKIDNEFMHFAVTFDYTADAVSVYLDGELLQTSSITTTFGVPVDRFSLPTSVKMDTSLGEEIIENPPYSESFLGPNILDEKVSPIRTPLPAFTPWILGGGYSDNIPAPIGSEFKPMGFLGSNTNHTHNKVSPGASYNTVVMTDTAGANHTFISGQHSPPLSSSKEDRIIPRSGLDGFLGSFKIYAKPLTKDEIKKNFKAQKEFFKTILIENKK